MNFGTMATRVKTGVESKNVRRFIDKAATKVGQPSMRGVINRAPQRTLTQTRRRGYRRMGAVGGALAVNGMITRTNNQMGYGSSGSAGMRPRSSGGYA